MNKLHKTLLLFGLRAQCQQDRNRDWQALHQRDREWFLQQSPQGRWQLAQRWLEQFAGPQPAALGLSPALITLIGFALGTGLMSGLLQFQPQQRINLWWWLLLAVWLPTLWWLVSLWFSRTAATGIWARSLLQRLPRPWLGQVDMPLLGRTAYWLTQGLSCGFAIGLTLSFFTYLALTDLAFGWSSTLEITSDGVYRLTQALALPWRSLWPDAAPTLQLIEQTRFFRIEDQNPVSGGLYGEWWRFLLMNLLLYVLLPRLLSLAWAAWRLHRAQQRLLVQDACIDGWWQRLHFEQVSQRGEPAPRNQAPVLDDQPAEPQDDERPWPQVQAIVTAHHWSDDQLTEHLRMLPAQLQQLPRLAPAQLDGQQEIDAVLLLCKGWEPPTGALADLCERIHQHGQQAFLWPAPLPGMKAARAQQLRASWRLFIPQLPASCHLLEPELG